MKNLFSIALVLMAFSCLNAQSTDSLDVVAKNIVAEATLLYKSEMASWYGTDLFVEKYKEKRENSGGYFSYSEKGVDKCIFYSKGNAPKVLATIEFNGVYSVEAAKDDPTERAFTELEKDLYTIRALATKQVASDTVFKAYKDMNFNLIPIIYKNQRKVYILTGPQKAGVVVFGNDYEVIFDRNNKITTIRKMHYGILPMDYSKEKEAVASMHSHNKTTGDFITVTDVCTLMLYAKFAKWKQHYVFSENYVSIWTAAPNSLLILTKKAWDKINDDQKKRTKEREKDKKD